MTVSSAAVRPEEIGQEEDAKMLDEAERKKFRSLAATLNYMGLAGSDVQDAAKEKCTKMANPTQRAARNFERSRKR